MRDKSSFSSRFQTLLTQSALSASVGAALGFLYVQFNLPPELIATKKLITGGYALAGAAAGVVTLRLALIGREILNDYRQGS